MLDKSKIILIILAVILLASFGIIFQLANSKQTLLQEKEEIKKEVSVLLKKVDENSREKKNLEDRLVSLNKSLENFSKEVQKARDEKEEAVKRYEAINRQKEALIEKLKERPESRIIEREAMREAPAKVLPPATEDVYWAGILKAKADLELRLENSLAELKKIQAENEQLKAERNSLSLEVKNVNLDLNRNNSELQRRLEYSERLTDGLTQELVREKNDKIQIQRSLDDIRQENSVLKQQLAEVDSLRKDLEKKVVSLEEKNSVLDESITKMEEFLRNKMLQIDTLTQQVSNLKQQFSSRDASSGYSLGSSAPSSSVELAPIVVRPQRSVSSVDTSSQAGRVVLVNRENSFVVINLGQDSGVQVGEKFRVFRNGQQIGTIEVIKVHPSISACDIKEEAIAISVGDTLG